MSTTSLLNTALVHRAVGTAHLVPTRLRALLRPRDERGLSQSTEQALLVAAAILVAGAIGIGVCSHYNVRINLIGFFERKFKSCRFLWIWRNNCWKVAINHILFRNTPNVAKTKFV